MPLSLNATQRLSIEFSNVASTITATSVSISAGLDRLTTVINDNLQPLITALKSMIGSTERLSSTATRLHPDNTTSLDRAIADMTTAIIKITPSEHKGRLNEGGIYISGKAQAKNKQPRHSTDRGDRNHKKPRSEGSGKGPARTSGSSSEGSGIKPHEGIHWSDTPSENQEEEEDMEVGHDDDDVAYGHNGKDDGRLSLLWHTC